MLQLLHGSRGEGGGGEAAGNVLGAADLPSPSLGAAAAAQLPGIGMCGYNPGIQKSCSAKDAGSPQGAAFVIPELLGAACPVLNHSGRTFQTFFPSSIPPSPPPWQGW